MGAPKTLISYLRPYVLFWAKAPLTKCKQISDNQLYPRAISDPVGASEVLPRASSPQVETRCCGGRLPASVVNKLNKLSARSGLFKMVHGEFGLRENLYYGSIFICMTLIVIVCFLVINNRGGAGLINGSAAYDGG